MKNITFAIIILLFVFLAGCATSSSTVKFDDYSYLTKEICEEQISKNDDVIQQLIKAGDNQSIEREIEHFIYFDTIEKKNAFCSEISNLGYRYEDMGGDIGVQIQKNSTAERNKINAVVLEVCNISAKHEGSYDGWGCLVQK